MRESAEINAQGRKGPGSGASDCKGGGGEREGSQKAPRRLRVGSVPNLLLLDSHMDNGFVSIDTASSTMAKSIPASPRWSEDPVNLWDGQPIGPVVPSAKLKSMLALASYNSSMPLASPGCGSPSAPVARQRSSLSPLANSRLSHPPASEPLLRRAVTQGQSTMVVLSEPQHAAGVQRHSGLESDSSQNTRMRIPRPQQAKSRNFVQRSSMGLGTRVNYQQGGVVPSVASESVADMSGGFDAVTMADMLSATGVGSSLTGTAVGGTLFGNKDKEVMHWECCGM